ncbi:hypothetical protein BOX15_Mlig033156g2 [Macrostomum lignano]|uniref:Uncharacterized protein n=2 Tax=Macrostomum lignano TaxID=282301 RepID=A0A267ESP6_9PLAT|nr:hypothetical protein BOX15_Mlig033156g1 [Macrostomum lignano]PAA82126.1 hypothetical protein BOX15_Mlig033156g2 [Macrostomum lignano]
MKAVAILLLALCSSAYAQLKYNDCGGSGHAARVSFVGVQPYPVKAQEGFTFTVSVRGSVSRDVGNSDFKLSLKRKTLGFWVPIPCLAGYGSCTYDNGCQLLEALLNDIPIPDVCSGIPQQQINLDQSITLPQIPGPLAWLVSGEYQAKGEFRDANGNVLCLELEGRLDS